MIIKGRNHFNHSIIIKSLKIQYLQRIYIPRFQINYCFKTFQT